MSIESTSPSRPTAKQWVFGFEEGSAEMRSPFETIDIPGVGELVKSAVERGRATRPDLQLGVCGEHAGDPASIEVFDSAGLDYLNCSPFRVPIARVAAAQAAADTAPARR
jgi:pyruvate, orthophosphate dikinase